MLRFDVILQGVNETVFFDILASILTTLKFSARSSAPRRCARFSGLALTIYLDIEAALAGAEASSGSSQRRRRMKSRAAQAEN